MCDKYGSRVSFCKPPVVRHIKGLSIAAHLLCPEMAPSTVCSGSGWSLDLSEIWPHPFSDFCPCSAKWVAQNKLCRSPTSQDFQNRVSPCYLYKCKSGTVRVHVLVCVVLNLIWLSTPLSSWCGGARWAGKVGPVLLFQESVSGILPLYPRSNHYAELTSYSFHNHA